MSRKNKVVNYGISIEETNGDQNKLIRKFCKKVKKLGILEKYREKMYYVKPSEKRRLKNLNKKRLSRRQKKGLQRQ